MSTSQDEAHIASELVAARLEGRSLTAFPGAVPADMAGAYRIQDLAIARWPDTLAGWKIGFIPADRRTTGAPDRLIGPIWRRQLILGEEHDAPPEVGVFASGFAAVEAELVVRLTRDLPARDGADWTAAEVADLEAELRIGIEVASSPIPEINALGPTVIAADFGNNNGLVLGPAIIAPSGGGSGGPGGRPPELDTSPAVRTACRIDDVLQGEGSADNLPGGLHHGLATALNLLAERGHPVRAGMVFATGATTGIHEIGVGRLCRVEVPDGPSVELRTVDVWSVQRSR